MKKIVIGIIALSLCILAGFLAGCNSKSSASAKNHEIIELVKGDSWIRPSIFRDTETGREYIVFRYDDNITVTPRLEKEYKE